MEIYVKNTLSLPVTNENGSYEIRLESIGGLGANLCGKMLGELGALSLSLNSLSFSSYGSEKRGSPVKAYVRWCADDRPLRVNSPVTRPHLLGIFHGGLIGTYPVLEGVTVDTKIVLNTPLSAEEAADKYHISIGELYCLDALALAMESHSRINMVMLGALVRASGFIPPEAAETLCRDTIGKKYPALIEANLAGLRLGYENVKMAQGDRNLAPLPDAPADARGVLTYQSQRNVRRLEDAGSYGYLCRLKVPSRLLPAILEKGEMSVEIRVPSSMHGGLALYGRLAGRYPMGLTVRGW